MGAVDKKLDVVRMDILVSWITCLGEHKSLLNPSEKQLQRIEDLGMEEW